MPHRAFHVILACAWLVLMPVTVSPHGGGIDRYGCHHDRKQGGYHCHRGEFAGRSFASQAEMLAARQLRDPAVPPPLPSLQFSGKVVGITDGDTITVLHNGRDERVRLHGIDCPEKGQPYGSKAKQFVSQLVFGKEVTVKDYGLDNTRSKRTLGEIVLLDGRVVNEELLRAGLAWWYRKYVPNRLDLAALEEEARNAKRGLWADPHPVPPWCWRKQQKGRAC
jgi:endonuclease YncB( thermonuclease family)